jgi:UDP-N-acetylglucosamine:LPS N-acetylglucosamine transferase
MNGGLYMDKQYLLTYQVPNKGWGTFSWFDTEEEMEEFIKETEGINVIEAFYIKDAEALNY